MAAARYEAETAYTLRSPFRIQVLEGVAVAHIFSCVFALCVFVDSLFPMSPEFPFLISSSDLSNG